MPTMIQATDTEMVEAGMLILVSVASRVFAGQTHEENFEKSRAVMGGVLNLFREELAQCGVIDVQPRPLMYLGTDRRFWRIAVLMDIRRDQLATLQQGPVGDHVQEIKPYEEFPEPAPLTLTDAPPQFCPFMERLVAIIKAQSQE